MQNLVINNIRLDLNKELQRVSVSVRQNDTTTRRLDITLVDHGQVVSLNTAQIALLMGTKPDGMQLYNDCVINGDEIQYTLTTQTINVVGEVRCQVQVTYLDGSMITSPEFLIAVYSPEVSDTIIESMNEYDAVSQFVVQAEQAAIRAETTAQGVEEMVQSAEDSAALSESWAVGGTGTRAYEDTNNSKYFSEAAQGAAEEAAALRTDAAHSAESAASSAEAAAASEEAAATSEEHCETYEQQTYDYAQTVEIQAQDTAQNAANALQSEQNAFAYRNLSESYAHGTNGTVRPGDAEDNSKYYMERAEEALSGNVVAAFEIDGEDLIYMKTMFDDESENHFDFSIKDHSNLEVIINE